MKVCRVDEMRNLDQTAIETCGIPDLLLMENAGLAVYSVILRELGIRDNCFLVVCGGGNNGGDGLVTARKLHSMGGDVHIALLTDPSQFKGAAEVNYQTALKLGLRMKRIRKAGDLDPLLEAADGVVDAIFGTGLTRPVEGLYARVIDAINAAGSSVVSIDIPSGIHGDSGQVMGNAVMADYTVTFGLPKAGNLLYPGYAYGGELTLTHIGFPPALYNRDGLLLEIHELRDLPPRNPQGHKTVFGDVLFIAGASGYYGAPQFAALSFLKAGGGYARLAAPVSMTAAVAARASEVVFVPMQETPSRSIAPANRDRLIELSEKADMVILGPGMSLEEETQKLIRDLVPKIRRPLLLDGDGLTALSANPDLLKKRRHPTILTPHPGEMARLTGRSAQEINANRIDVLQKACKDLKSVIVLKGAHTLTGTPEGRVFFNLSGNSGMATAGSGDVLTGAIAAMAGTGFNPEEAVKQGVFIHGLAGDLAAQDIGEDGMTAWDILKRLPEAVRLCRESADEIRSAYAVEIL